MRVIEEEYIQNTRKAFRILLAIPERKNRLENIGKDVRIMFRVSIKKQGLTGANRAQCMGQRRPLVDTLTHLTPVVLRHTTIRMSKKI